MPDQIPSGCRPDHFSPACSFAEGRLDRRTSPKGDSNKARNDISVMEIIPYENGRRAANRCQRWAKVPPERGLPAHVALNLAVAARAKITDAMDFDPWLDA